MRRSSAPMAVATVADSTNAVEVADLLKEAVAAGTASEAVRSVLSSDEGAEFAELLVQQLTAPSSLLWARKQAALAQTKNAISSFS